MCLKITAWPDPTQPVLAHRCFLGPALPSPFSVLKFSGLVRFRPARVKVQSGPARPVNKMNACYKQFVSCFLENLFLAKTSKLEITAVTVSLYTMNNSLAKAKNEETI